MNQSYSLPTIARVTFLIHLIVAGVIGILLIIIPTDFGSWFGYPAVKELEPVLRAFGTLLLGLGALTSFYGRRAKSWEQVDYIVRGEIAYLTLQTIVFVVSGIFGVGPALGNWLFAALSVVLLGLFLATWFNCNTSE